MHIYEEILKALETEPRIMLATIIATTGSTPAAALSKMIVKQSGIASVGTIGGGCMEGDVLLHANRLYDSGKAEILTFHLNEDDIEHGLICGGNLDVLLEPLTRESIPLFRTLKTHCDDGEDCILATVIPSGGTLPRKTLLHHEENSLMEMSRGFLELINSLQPSVDVVLQSALRDAVMETARRNETRRVKITDGEVIFEPVAGAPSLVIFGGGHVAKFISRSAAMAGFRVTIVDDREKFANAQRFPEASSALAADFLESFSRLTVTSSTYIVIVTRGHRHDEEILERAVGTPARYIGMIGSRRKVVTTFRHLMEKGISASALRRVHAPIGIDIGAITAEEIGVSIVAQLIAVRRNHRLAVMQKSDETEVLISGIEQELQRPQP